MITESGFSEHNSEPFGSRRSDIYCQVNCCGVDHFTDISMMQQRREGRRDYYILYCTDGQVTGTIDDMPVSLYSGDFLCIAPGVPHTFSYDCSKVRHIYWLHMTGYGIAQILDTLELKCGTVYRPGVSELLSQLFNNIIRALQLKSPGHDIQSNGLLLQLLSAVSQHLTTLFGKTDAIESAVLLIHRTFNHDLTVRQLADYANLTPHHFIHRFRDYTGRSPLQYIQTLRLEQAKKLLVTTALSIGEIAHNIGYTDPLYFSRLFKNKSGFSPSAWRKNYGSNESIT